MTYKPPIEDLRFALATAGYDRLAAFFPAADEATSRQVLEAAGALAEKVLAPLNHSGDEEGSRLENGRVAAPAGFKEAYRAFAEGGWTGLTADSEVGGQGLPRALQSACYEMFQAANMAFALCPTLSLAAIDALMAHGEESQRRRFLPRLVSGEWTGTMNLTEPQAGSDLGAIRTRAQSDGEGHWRLTGEKIFITWGDHDLADNIVHMVLARLPDSPPGTRGLSLFAVPARLVGEDGEAGEANALVVASIEKKLGIHASPTCVMRYEGAAGELVGTPHQGLAAMFTMMNAARLQVGVQGVGIAERAFQGALAFSLERAQGRSAWTGAQPSPLFDHPDVRRTLMIVKAKIEAARALCLSCAVAADLARLAPNPVDREAARLREDLLTPIAKAWSTDRAVEAASASLQVFGGMGFIEETGAAQPYRDARILPIYEGTNGIQAIDLMGRKLAIGKGEAVRQLVSDMFVDAAALKSAEDPWLHPVGGHLEAALAAIQAATGWLLERRGHAQPDALAGAAPYLELMGDAVGGWMLGRQALAASEKLAAGDPDEGRWKTRIALARVFASQILARAPGLGSAVSGGAVDLYRASAAALGR